MFIIKRRLSLKHLVLIPLIFLLMRVPAFLAGRDVQSLLTIYAGQVTDGNGSGVGQFHGRNAGQFNGGGPGQTGSQTPRQFGGQGNSSRTGGFGGSSSSSLTANAPSFYQWLPASAPEYGNGSGLS